MLWSNGRSMKRFLIATDGSPSSRKAIEFGLDLARTQRGHAIIVHVAPAFETLPMAGSSIAGARQHRLSDVDRRPLTEAAEMAADRGVLVRTELLQGEPAREIVRLADGVEADVIVIGSRGRGAVAGVVLGSVPRAVLHGSRRSMLVVRAA
jgi:nucleotide-binding universal stress UspA family protein